MTDVQVFGLIVLPLFVAASGWAIAFLAKPTRDEPAKPEIEAIGKSSTHA